MSCPHCGEDCRCSELRPPEAAQDTELPSWKQEVAARVQSYKARRKTQVPRYPSLQLRFASLYDRDSRDIQTVEDAPTPDDRVVPDRESCPTHGGVSACVAASACPATPDTPTPEIQAAEPARIIEFPLPYALRPRRADEIAEPVVERLRIVEVPEIQPPLPALGGITLESQDEETEKGPGFEIPLQAAPILRRLFAHTLDVIVVLTACALFAYIYFAISKFDLPLQQIARSLPVVAAAFWIVYQYLLVVYAGSTLGQRASGLRLRCFDGTLPSRGLRRWRVVATIVAVIPFGLGIAWCYFDEDTLCWHDRITGTYLAFTTD